jgi:hypothetical protein
MKSGWHRALPFIYYYYVSKNIYWKDPESKSDEKSKRIKSFHFFDTTKGGATALSITTFSMVTFSVTIQNTTFVINDTLFLLQVLILSVIMLDAAYFIIMQIVVMLNVIMQSVARVSVVAPPKLVLAKLLTNF